MKIDIHSQGITLSSNVKNHTDTKARLALGVFSSKINKVDIYLSDVNGPKGGEDMLCKVITTAYGEAPFAVQEKAKTLYEAINVCLHRVKRSASRKFEKRSNRRMPRAGIDMNIALD